MSFLLDINFSPVMDNVLNDPILDAFTLLATKKILGIASGIMGGFVLLKLGWEYLKYSLNSVNDSNFVGKIFDLTEASRVLVLIFLLSLYIPLVQSFMGAFRTFNHATQINDMTASKAQEILNEYDFYYLKAQTNTNLFGEEYMDLNYMVYSDDSYGELMEAFHTPPEKKSWWDRLSFSIDDFVASILNVAAYGITKFIFFGFSAYCKVVLKLLVIIGPLAIVMSVLFKDKFMSWFSAFLNTGLVFVLLNILNYIVLNFLMADWNMLADTAHQNDASLNIWKSIAFNVAIIGSYFSVFRLTALWVGNTLAGAIISKGLSVAGVVAGLALMGASTAKNAVSGGAGGAKGGGSSGNLGKKMGEASSEDVE